MGMPDRTLDLTAADAAQWNGPPRSAHPTAVVAMAGAGQLAQMTQQAAVSLGIELRVLAQKPEEGAVAAGARALIGDNSAANLRALAEGAAVLTFDHEGFDPEMLSQLKAEGLNLAPSPRPVPVARARLVAREHLSRLGYPLPPFAVAGSIEDFDSFAAEHG